MDAGRHSYRVRPEARRLLIFGAAAGAVVLRFTALGRQPLWLDEATDASFAARSLHDCIVAEIVHPPLYRTLLHLVVSILGDSAFAVRFLPALFGVLAVLALALVARRLWPQAESSAVALAAASPFLLFYSQENRNYSLLILLTLLATWAFLRFRQEGRGLLLYCGICLALLYTHYVAAFVLLAHEWIYWRFSRQRRRDWLMARMALAAAFLPWLWWIAGRYQPESRLFVAPASLVPLALLRFFLGYGIWAPHAVHDEQPLASELLQEAPVVLPSLSLFLWLLYGGIRRMLASPQARELLAVMILLPWTALVLLAPWVELSHERYLAFQAPFLLLLVAAGWSSLRGAVRQAASLSLAVVVGFSLAAYYAAPGSVLGYRFRYGKENWAGAAAFIRQQQADAVVVAPAYLSMALNRYPLGAARQVLPAEDSPLPDLAGYQRIALVMSRASTAQERIAAWLDATGLRIAQANFPSQNRIRVTIYASASPRSRSRPDRGRGSGLWSGKER